MAEIKAAYRLHLLEFLEMLRNLEVGAAAQEKIFFCHKIESDYLGKVETVLRTRADILASDKPETYAWILEDFESSKKNIIEFLTKKKKRLLHRLMRQMARRSVRQPLLF